jgi:hypothetical protein
VRLRLEYRRKHVYYNVDIKNGGTRSRFTMFGEECSYIYRVWCYRGVAIYTGVVLQGVCSYIYGVGCNRRCVAIYTGCGATGGV